MQWERIKDGLLHTQLGQALLLLVLLLAVVGGVMIERAWRRAQAFEGVVVEKERKRRWSESRSMMEHKRYRHYLVIETPDGDTRRTRVHHHIFARAEVGDPVEKRPGETRLRILTEEEIERRAGSERALRLLRDAVTE